MDTPSNGGFLLPDDFHARVRAARGYMAGISGLQISQAAFGEKLRMSEGYVRQLESGRKSIRDLEGRGLVARLAEITGLSEGFFLGEETAVDRRLRSIEDQLAAVALNVEARVLEVLRRLDSMQPPEQGSQR